MMLNIDNEDKRSGFVRYFPVGLVIMLLLMVLIISAEGPKYFGLAVMPSPAPEPANYSNIAQLGSILYTDYAYPFEIAGVILLTAIIAAITLAHRKPHRRKIQDIRPAKSRHSPQIMYASSTCLPVPRSQIKKRMGK